MRGFGFTEEARHLLPAAALALLAVFVSALVIAASLMGRPASLLQFEQVGQQRLSAGTNIDASASFDKESYFTGEIAVYEIVIRYRDDVVTPDFSDFAHRVSLFPFERFDSQETTEEIGFGTTEYRLTCRLQLMDVPPAGRYEFEPAVIYYANAGASSALKPLSIEQPDVYISSYYPPNVSKIELQAPVGKIRDPVLLRSGLLILSATALLALVFSLLWFFGRRRSTKELAEAEQLWFEFNRLRDSYDSNREYLLASERILCRIFQRYARLPPQQFWSGTDSTEGGWSDVIRSARKLLLRSYLRTEPSNDDVERITILLENTLASLVEEERLLREQEPSFIARVRTQPGLLLVSGTLSAIALLILVLSFSPSIWMSPDVARYNRVIRDFRSGSITDTDAYSRFSALADDVELETVKAAAFYNAGRLRAHSAPPELSRSQRESFLDIVFGASSAEELIQSMLLSGFVNSQEEVVMLLINSADYLRSAGLNFRSAARLSGNDERTLRNLELVVKRRDAVLQRLAQLRDVFSAGNANEENAPAAEQGLLNVIDENLPEEYKEEQKREGDQTYMILEQF